MLGEHVKDRFESGNIDPEKLIYELEAHQVELELQNEELRRVQKELKLRERGRIRGVAAGCGAARGMVNRLLGIWINIFLTWQSVFMISQLWSRLE